ncbi:preprotein translocase subunit SecG [Prevotella sp. E13-27]|jgi:preprotein translocase subunit SecG|uniref:preprotein translocase subunit SecG n=1 Tax=Prevotella sp. E13-27 TaxID=2938122 RepID=UPI00200AED6D|nr:preprotein translocase subunit SecG [Prevotella sp. E13-27]MBQ7662715.1 preprotein translocase subunit SecG [Prevotella sp.]MCK8623379.1 preprotein translocase subunit SecG [Prevotella sp. E13-27]
MYTILVALIVLASICMIIIVLMQESKGGGLASNYASYNQIGGVRKTTEFIEKATFFLAAFMVVISVLCAYVAPKGASEGSVIEGIELPATNSSNLPGFNASQTQPTEAPAAPATETPEN